MQVDLDTSIRLLQRSVSPREGPVTRNVYLGVVFAIAIGCSDDESESHNPSSSVDAGAPDAGDDSAPPSEDGTDPLPPLADDVALPIVFVHGFSGSAQQFTSQAMRFVANGYPAERLRAYEHDGAGMGVADFIPGADAVVDEVRAKFGTDKVFLIG